ncbi:hypothetical protein K501DRAFT_268667 [Backusella circina FSU 941]|nr:hypothetical protein K501DRAFT_268667 [Backusella circina FSU 941]
MFFKSTEKLKPSYAHPLDPSVDHEYEILVQSWKDQLVQNTPNIPNADYARYAWLQLMDHYLDQQWLDSKQMLQCAQAWSGRELISVSEAVHTMNILSLKFMQRSLDTRKELLNTLNDPDLMMALGISPCSGNHDEEKYLRDNESFHSVDIGKEVNLPPSFSDADSQDNASLHQDVECGVQERQALDECDSVRESLFDVDVKKRDIFEEGAFGLQNCLRYSRSMPDFSLELNSPDNHDTQSMSSFKDIQITRYGSDNSSTYSSTASSQSEFFLHSHDGPVDNATNFFTIRQSTLYKAGFADEKAETDSVFDEVSESTNMYSNYRLCVPNQEEFNMIKSESSISVLQTSEMPRGSFCPNKRATIVKSRSFPTKEALLSDDDQKITNKDKGFMLRAIVNKKPYFSRFFGVKRN